MVGVESNQVTEATTASLRRYHFGSVILMESTGASPKTVRKTVDGYQAAAGKAGPLWVATDQEGGQVQRLHAPGFTKIPSAASQATMSPSQLTQQATQWGQELVTAGINLDLAPVADVVPGAPANNPPVGALRRGYGATPAEVVKSASAFIKGLKGAGISSCIKHFPGLGRVTANTDFSSGVVDTVTSADEETLASFRELIPSVPFVMVSTAVYSRIDANQPAAFSPVVITKLLRQKLGFNGVIISDDLSAAAQVTHLSPGDRAIRFIDAGGDVIIATGQDSAKAMYTTVLARARTDSGFRNKVLKAARQVRSAKSMLLTTAGR